MEFLIICFLVILIAIIVAFFRRKSVMPNLANNYFPEKDILNILNKKKEHSIKYEVIDYYNSPFFEGSFINSLKYYIPTGFFPYHTFVYRIIINDSRYWVLFLKSTSFFHKNKIEIQGENNPGCRK